MTFKQAQAEAKRIRALGYRARIVGREHAIKVKTAAGPGVCTIAVYTVEVSP